MTTATIVAAGKAAAGKSAATTIAVATAEAGTGATAGIAVTEAVTGAIEVTVAMGMAITATDERGSRIVSALHASKA